MTVKLLTKQNLEFPSLKGGSTASLSIHVKMPHCWKLCVTAHIINSLPASDYNIYPLMTVLTQISLDVRSGPKLFYTLVVFMKFYLKTLILITTTAADNNFKMLKNYQAFKELIKLAKIVGR